MLLFIKKKGAKGTEILTSQITHILKAATQLLFLKTANYLYFHIGDDIAGDGIVGGGTGFLIEGDLADCNNNDGGS